MGKSGQTDDRGGSKPRFDLSTFFPSSPFVRSFAEAMLAGLVILALIVGWMTLRFDRTAEMIQTFIPTKAAQIESSTASENLSRKDDAKDSQDGHASLAPAEPLPPAPIEGLTEAYGSGVLPVASTEKDLTPFEAYRKPFTPKSGKSLVSIVVVDYGLSETTSHSMLANLPAEISFVLTPYAHDAASWGAKAREAGHEFWLSMPMETQNPTAQDAGPLAIMVNASLEENNSRLFTLMSSTSGYAGLVSQKDHRFVKTDMDVSPVMKQVFGRGLAFAESNPAIPAYGLSLAMEFAYPYVQNTFWIDASLRSADIDRVIRQIERQAQSKGRVVAFVHPYPVAIRKIQDWLDKAEDNNIQIAPLSAMVQ